MPHGRFPLSVVCLLAFLSACPIGTATGRPIAQQQHTSWSMAEGAPPDVWAIAQTGDGYLWLGTGDGLYRFDGVRFEQITPKGRNLPHTDIVSLLATRRNDLWIGYQDGGVSRMRNGSLENYPGFPRVQVRRMVEDGSHGVWVLSATRFDRGGLQRFSNGRWEAIAAGLPEGTGADDVAVDPAGTVWLLVDGYLYFLPAGHHVFEKSPIDPFARYRHGTVSRADTFGYLRFASDSSLWVASHGSFLRVTAGLTSGAPATVSNGHGKALYTRAGELWYLVADRIAHLSKLADVPVGGVAESAEEDFFTRADGLTSNSTGTLFEDREGNVWVSTNVGLERFHPGSLVTQGGLAPNVPGYKLTPGPEDSFYLLQAGGLFRLDQAGGVTKLRSSHVWEGAFCPDNQGGVWAASRWSRATQSLILAMMRWSCARSGASLVSGARSAGAKWRVI